MHRTTRYHHLLVASLWLSWLMSLSVSFVSAALNHRVGTAKDDPDLVVCGIEHWPEHFPLPGETWSIVMFISICVLVVIRVVPAIIILFIDTCIAVKIFTSRRERQRTGCPVCRQVEGQGLCMVRLDD